MIGIAATTPVLPLAYEIAKFCKENFPEVTLIIGGAHVTILPERTLKESLFDIAVIGEGEETFRDLVDLYKNERLNHNNLKKTKGIAFKNNGKIIITEKRPFKRNIDEIPFPARDLMNIEFYKKEGIFGKWGAPSLGLISSRGCPYKCSFCANTPQPYRFHSANYTFSEMENLVEKYKLKGLAFFDDTFTANRQRVVDLCQKLIDSKLNEKIIWSCLSRVDRVDKELLQLMKKSGCVLIKFGFESGSPRILSLLKKNTTTVEMNKRAIQLSKEVGIKILGYFMIGSPTETLDDVKMTEKFIFDNPIDYTNLFITTPYPGTEIWDYCIEKGMITGNEPWDTLLGHDNPKAYACDTIPRDLILKIHKELNWRIIRRNYSKLELLVRSLRDLRRTSFYLKGGLLSLIKKIR